eukprot:scaffold168701_cov13-Tisochrysis_lutea.AAC.1
MIAPLFPTPPTPGTGDPAQYTLPVTTNVLSSHAQENAQEPPGPGPALQNMLSLNVGPAELADVLGVP